jgi:hypothetical protein
VDNPYAIIRDTGLAGLSEALNHAGTLPAPGRSIPVHVGGRIHFHSQSGRWKFSLAAREVPAFGWPRAAVCNTLFIPVLALFLAGCSVLKPATTLKTTPLASVDTQSAPDPAPAAKPPESAFKPEQPLPQKPSPSTETPTPPATTSRGAEKLVAPTMVAPEKRPERAPPSVAGSVAPAATKPEKQAAAAKPVPARASEKTPPTTPLPDPKPPFAPDSASVTSAPVQDLILKGPPRQPPRTRTVAKTLKWLGLGLGVAILALVGRFFLVHRTEAPLPFAANEEALRMPRELGFKESVAEPRDRLGTDRL